MEERTDIELRSEKVRSIVGKMPPMLLRIGISVIAGVLLIVLGLLYFIPYPETKTFPVKIALHHEDSTFYATSSLNIRAAKPIQTGQKVIIKIQSLHGDYRIFGQIWQLDEDHGEVDLSIVITDADNYTKYLTTSPVGEATVYISRTPLLRRIQ